MADRTTISCRQSPEDLRLCRTLADDLAAWWDEQREDNPTGLSAPDRAYIGNRGEFAFADLMLSLDYAIRHTFREDGVQSKAQGVDIELPLAEETIGIEVKTSSEPFHQWLMVPDNHQWERLQAAHIVVGCRLMNDNEVHVMGWVGRKEFDRFELHHPDENPPVAITVPTRMVRYRDTDDIAKLWPALLAREFGGRVAR